MKDLFYEKVSKHCNYANSKVVADIYLGLMRLIVHELRTTGEIELPSLGKFYTKTYKSRVWHNVNTGKKETMPPIKTIKFAPCHPMKAYFKFNTDGPFSQGGLGEG